MTVRNWILQATDRLRSTGISNPRLEAQIIIAHCLRIDRDKLLLCDDQEAPSEANLLLHRRLKGEPLAYILGCKEFYRRRFEVSPDVLIPRSETETLVEAVIELAPQGSLCVDVGTGSGCIGITCALERPDTRWILTDISEPAVQVAQKNARNHRAQAAFLIADLLEAFQRASLDVVACNPPYVAPDDTRLESSVREFEPALALFAGDEGLEHFKRLAHQVARVVKPRGCLFLEVGESQAAIVAQIFEDATKRIATGLQVRKDLAGTERVIIVYF